MNKKTFQNTVLFSMVLMAFLFFSVSEPPLFAAQGTVASPDVVIKISRLDRTLEVLDTLAAAIGPESGITPGAMAKGMLHGTEWIDFSRPMVIGIEIKDPQPVMALLIPFKRPNPGFQSDFQPEVGPDYYFLSIPPGAGKPPAALEPALASAARSKPGASVSAEIAVDNLLIKADSKIRQAVEALKAIPREESPENMPLEPEELHTAVLKIIDTARQLKNLNIRIDLSPEEAAYEMSLLALAGSEMAALFTKEEGIGRLGGYRSQLAMNFRSRPLQTERMLSLIGEAFGKFYQSMGIDFSKIVEISAHFTGEMSGGMSFQKDRIALEMIHVLKGGPKAKTFVKDTYLPWLADFGKAMQNTMENRLKTPLEPVFTRMPDSMVAGHPVYGVKFRFPLPPTPQKVPNPLFFKTLGIYEFRMTVVDDLLLSASTEERLNRLIQNAVKLKPTPAKGPVMTFEYDLATYLESLREMIPGFPGASGPLPRLGKMVTVLDADGGRAFLRSAIKMHDIHAIIAYFKGIPPSEIVAAKKGGEKGPETGKSQKPSLDEKPLKTVAGESSAWVEKGALAAFHGDTPAAVAHFMKAVEIQPDNSDAHFQLGVAFGELGEYPKALSALDRAIELNPEKGAYFYARGRVYLLANERKMSMEDFKRAAEQGDPDARRYLKMTTGNPRN